jgi:hypothetical protein
MLLRCENLEGLMAATGSRAAVLRTPAFGPLNPPKLSMKADIPARQPSAMSGREQMQQGPVFAVGTRVTSRPPHRTVRAAFPHTAPTLGPDGKQIAVCVPALVTREPGAESRACFASPHSPRSLPLAPPTPQRIAPICSSASQLLWHGQTSRARTSSATAPHLPDADRPSHATLTVRYETSQLPMRSFCT